MKERKQLNYSEKVASLACQTRSLLRLCPPKQEKNTRIPNSNWYDSKTSLFDIMSLLLKYKGYGIMQGSSLKFVALLQCLVLF